MRKKARRLKPNSRLPFLIVGMLTLLGVATYVWFRLRPQPQPSDVMQVTIPGGKVNLSFSPSSLTLEPGAEKTASLQIDTADQKVTAVQVELAYDATKLEVPVVTRSNLLTKSLQDPKIENGKITFTFAVDPAVGSIAGSGTLATLRLKLKPGASGASTLRFTENTKVAALGWNKNVLQSALDLAINQGAVASVTPSATPLASSPTGETCSSRYIYITASKACVPTAGYTFDSQNRECSSRKNCAALLKELMSGKTSGVCYGSLQECRAANQ